MHAAAYMWRSEGTMCVPEMEGRLSGLVASTFTHGAILPAFTYISYCTKVSV